MKALIICHSHHHLNTKKIAATIANVIGAEVKTPQEAESSDIPGYSLIGFGSGIYYGKHHKDILKLASNLPQAANQQAFIFSTGGEEGKGEKKHKKLREQLQAKGYQILSEFNCPGYDTTIAAKLFGSQQKGRPNQEDLQAAQTFAHNLKQAYNVLLLCDTATSQKI